MDITLRDYQKDAARFLRSEIERGGDMTVNLPASCGRTIIIAEAVRDLPGVAFVSRIREMREQMMLISKDLGVNIEFAKPGDDLSEFSTIILSEELRNFEPKHPHIVRM